MNITEWILVRIKFDQLERDLFVKGWNYTVRVILSLISILKGEMSAISTCWPLSLPVVFAIAILSPTCHPICIGSCFVRNVVEPAWASALEIFIIVSLKTWKLTLVTSKFFPFCVREFVFAIHQHHRKIEIQKFQDNSLVRCLDWLVHFSDPNLEEFQCI